MTYLAAAIPVIEPVAAVAALGRAQAAGAEMLELRLDYLAEPTAENVHAVVAAAKGTGLPVIATCRAAWEGGRFKGSEKARKALFKQAVRAGADFIDVESACRADGEMQLDEIIGKAGTRVIRSSHDFEGLPVDLAERLGRLNGQRPGIAKLAYQAATIGESWAAVDYMHTQAAEGKEVIAMAMGEAGMWTRLVAAKLGGFLTFAALDDKDGTAPGQVKLEQMRKLYRFGKAGAETTLFGVIGYPIGHSLSPAIHNAALEAAGYDGLYVPLLVAPTWAEFRALLDGFRARPWLDWRGLSVTIPHKENALRYVEMAGGELEPLAAKIGAVNTVVFDEGGGVRGYNTDYAGALDAITAGAGITRDELAGMPTAVVGAGGVARALVAGLRDCGAEVSIYNRTAAKAELLAAEFGAMARPAADLAALEARLVVNCTSLGMHPHTEATAVPAEALKPGMIVFDTVYNPRHTRLLREARAAGATTVDGLAMFVNQAAWQFGLFTQMTPPTEVMREVVAARLAL